MTALAIVNGPLSLYWAPVGTAFPKVDESPISPWTLIGSSGPTNYTEDGVVISTEQTVEEWRGLGNTFPIKAFRTEESRIITVTVADLTVEQVRLAMNFNAITTTAAGSGQPGQKSISLNRGVEVVTVALLVRGIGKSPAAAGLNIQFEFPRVYDAAASSLTFVKGEPAGVMLEFRSMLDDAGEIGRYIVQTAPRT